MKRGGMIRPSPLKSDPEKTRAWQQRSRKPMKRSPLQKVNKARAAKRYAEYRAVLASPFHKKLRYEAWKRAGGLCECPLCRQIREMPPEDFGLTWDIFRPDGERAPTRDDVDRAWTPVPIWFTKSGGEPWKRFRCKEGSIHHRSYKWYGQEKEGELELVIFTWNSCHARIESEHGTRRRYLTKGAA